MSGYEFNRQEKDSVGSVNEPHFNNLDISLIEGEKKNEKGLRHFSNLRKKKRQTTKIERIEEYPLIKRDVQEFDESERVANKIFTSTKPKNTIQPSEEYDIGHLVKEFYGWQADWGFQERIDVLANGMKEINRKHLDLQDEEKQINHLRRCLTEDNQKLKSELDEEQMKIDKIKQFDATKLEQLQVLKEQEIEKLIEREEEEKRMNSKMRHITKAHNDRMAEMKEIKAKLKEYLRKEREDKGLLRNKVKMELKNWGRTKLPDRINETREVKSKEVDKKGIMTKIFKDGVILRESKTERHFRFPDGYIAKVLTDGSSEEVVR